MMPHPLQLSSMGFLDLPPSSTGRGHSSEKYSGLRPSLRDVPSLSRDLEAVESWCQILTIAHGAVTRQIAALQVRAGLRKGPWRWSDKVSEGGPVRAPAVARVVKTDE